MAPLTKEEFAAALVTVDPQAFEDHNWLWRFNSWEKVNNMGAKVAAFSRQPGVAEVVRPIAPQFFDWLQSAFPPSGDAAIFRIMEEEEAVRIEAGRRYLEEHGK